MTINELASKIAKMEGKKSQARVGDIREILGILSDLISYSPLETLITLLENGKKRRDKWINKVRREVIKKELKK